VALQNLRAVEVAAISHGFQRVRPHDGLGRFADARQLPLTDGTIKFDYQEGNQKSVNVIG
jgi:hypothetical protein